MKKMIIAAAMSVFIAMASLVAFTQAADKAARSDHDMANAHKAQHAQKHAGNKADAKNTTETTVSATTETAKAVK